MTTLPGTTAWTPGDVPARLLPVYASPHLKAQVVEDEAAFLSVAGAWRAGNPFPLLRGEAAERAVALDADARGERHSSAPGWSGTVVCASADDVTVAASRVYAAATGRPLVSTTVADLEATLRASADEDVALVTTRAELASLPYWPTEYAPRTGVLTARTSASLLALLYRTLARPAFPAAPVTSVVYGTFPGAEAADVRGYDQVDLLVGRRSSVVSLRGHGRECCVHLVDAVVCGRGSLTLTPTAVPGRELAACELDGMCIRRDLDDSRRVLARSIRADLVFVESCRAIAIGDDWLSFDLALSLGLLEGDAVALIGAMGTYSDRGLASFVVGAIVAGASLGTVVARLNEDYGSPISAHSTFGLLGDPGLRLDAQVAAESVVAPSRPQVLPTPARDGVVTPAVATGGGSGVGRAFLERMSLRPTGTGRRDDEGLLATVLRRIREPSWDVWSALYDFDLCGVRATTCPSCGSARASLLNLRCEPLGAAGAGIVCARCADLLWHVYGEGGPPAIELVGAKSSPGVPRGTEARLSVSLRNATSAELAVNFAAAVRHGYGAKIPATHLVPVLLEPHGIDVRTVGFAIPHETRVDQLKVVWLAAAGNEVLIRAHSLWIR